jgi:hypothetical protein
MNDAAPQPDLEPELDPTVGPDAVDETAADGGPGLRRLLLATLASLLIHLLLAGGLATTTLGTLAGPARDPAAIKAVLKPKVAADFPLQVPRSGSEKAAHERPQDLRIPPDASKAARKPEIRPREDRSVSRDRQREPEERIATSAARLERARPPRDPVAEPPPAAAAPMPRQAVASPAAEPKAQADLSAVAPAKDVAAAAAKPQAVERQRPAEPAAATSQSRQPREVAILAKPKAAAEQSQLPSLRTRPADAATAPTAARPPNRAAAAADTSAPAATAAAIAATAPAPQPPGGPQAPAPARTAGPSARRPQPIRAADRPATEFDDAATTAGGRSSADAVRAIAGTAGSNRAATEPAATLAAAGAPKRAAVLGDSPAGGGDATAAPIAMPALGGAANSSPAGGASSAGTAPGPAATAPLAARAGSRTAAVSGGAAGIAPGEMGADEPSPATFGGTVAPLAVAPALADRGSDREDRREPGGDVGLPAAGPPMASPGRAAVLADMGPVADDPVATADELPAGSIAPTASAGPVADASEGWQPARLTRSEAAPAAALASIGGRGIAPTDDEGLSKEDTPPAGPLATGLPRGVGPRRDANGHETPAAPAPTAAALSRVAAVVLPVEGRVREIAKPFERRARENRPPADRPLIPAETEAVVDRGLDFLVRAQQPDGRWSLGRYPGGTPADAPKLQSDTAATGLALLSFLGAGHDHFDGRHRDTVRKGLEFLLSVQKPDGDLYIPSDQLSNSCAWLYSHGIATMALCEAVGMTGDEIVKPAAERACGFIVAAQHPERGGWRYTPRSDADLSVSGWMLVALRSGQLAGLTIEGKPLDGVRGLLDAATAPAAAGRPVYLYNPRKPDQRPSQSSTACMTALGTLMRLHTGSTASDQRVVDAAKALETAVPAYGTREQKIRDCYLWYYASQVLVHTGGDGWERWYRALREQLAARQETTGEKRGSWDPLGSVPDRWGLYGGRLYVTTLHLLTLEVPARRLPTYSLDGD